MYTRKTWHVLRRGEVPDGAAEIEFPCPHCGVDARLPVAGVPIAQLICGGVVFDAGGCLPDEIRCRTCRRVFVTGERESEVREDVRQMV